jgi:hypothetical protein
MHVHLPSARELAEFGEPAINHILGAAQRTITDFGLFDETDEDRSIIFILASAAVAVNQDQDFSQLFNDARGRLLQTRGWEIRRGSEGRDATCDGRGEGGSSSFPDSPSENANAAPTAPTTI